MQRGLAQHLMTLVGVDTQRGRLDVSTHPFCGGATDDMRITTRYDEADFSSALMADLHESGTRSTSRAAPGAGCTSQSAEPGE